MTDIEKLKDKLKPTNTFDLRTLTLREDNLVWVETYKNCLIAITTSAEAERKIKCNPYAHILQSGKVFISLIYFPKNLIGVEDILKGEYVEQPQLKKKYQTRLQNLIKAHNFNQIKLYNYLCANSKTIMQLKFTGKQIPKREDYDYRDNFEDTSCKEIAKKLEPFATIQKVSLSYSTVLILENAKESKNKSLFRYLNNSKAFYADCIVNYILEHSKIIAPENFRDFYNPINEVHMSACEFRKLYPSRAKLKMPEGVKINFGVAGTTRKRLSKKDTVTITFSEDFLNRYKSILKHSEENAAAHQSFVKVPMFFILNALKKENLGANGFQFLLWILPFFRMKSPKIYHSIKTIMEETGMDTTHGYKQPLALLQKYFDYLYRSNVLANVSEPLKFNNEPRPKGYKQLTLNLKIKITTPPLFKQVDEPPKYKGKFIQLQKPKKIRKKLD